MSGRRAKQRRRLERIAATGNPERDKDRPGLLSHPMPGSWDPMTERMKRERDRRSRLHRKPQKGTDA